MNFSFVLLVIEVIATVPCEKYFFFIFYSSDSYIMDSKNNEIAQREETRASWHEKKYILA